MRSATKQTERGAGGTARPGTALGRTTSPPDGDELAVARAYRDGGVDALAGQAHGAGDGQAARATQAFAVEGNEVLRHGTQLRVLPAEEQRLEGVVIEGGQGALIVALGGHGAEVLADQGGILEIMMGGDFGIPAGPFGLGDRTHPQVT